MGGKSRRVLSVDGSDHLALQTLVIVKPPPSSSNKNKLNLQIQLVTAQPKRSANRTQRVRSLAPSNSSQAHAASPQSASASSTSTMASSTGSMYIPDTDADLDGDATILPEDTQTPTSPDAARSAAYARLAPKPPSSANGSATRPSFSILQSATDVTDHVGAQRTLSGHVQPSPVSSTFSASGSSATEGRRRSSPPPISPRESRSSLRAVAFAQSQAARARSPSQATSSRSAITPPKRRSVLVVEPDAMPKSRPDDAADRRANAAPATKKGRPRALSSASSMESSQSTPSAILPDSASRMSVGAMSIDSESTTGRPRKQRIVPLYNLAVHNVMTTNVTDAGTDAKVAKFQKHATEVVGVGQLEPTEVWWYEATSLFAAHPISSLSTRSDMLPTSEDPEEMASPTRRSVSTYRGSLDLKKLNPATFLQPSTAHQSPSGEREAFARTKKVFSGLFGRKKASGNPSLAPDTVPAGLSGTASDVAYAAPTFGCAPAVSTPLPQMPLPGQGPRPKYAFAVRQWSSEKGGGLGVSNGWAKGYRKAPAGEELPVPDEVTFEWVRGRRPRSSRRSSADAGQQLQGASMAMSRSSSGAGPAHSPSPAANLALPLDVRSASASSSPRVSHDGSSDRAPSPAPNGSDRKARRPVSTASSRQADEDAEDDGCISDPEDSETPWHCIVRVPAHKRRRGKTGRPSKYAQSGQVVASLYPAPHHPRIVAQLKVPYDLEPIATGLASTAPQASSVAGDAGEEILLSVENIKDVVSTTAMWLVVREEFAGLGRKKKAL